MSKHLSRAWLPALLWLAVIALESSQIGSSQNTSRLLLAVLTFLFGNIDPATFLHIHSGLRKAGHFVGYAVLSLLMFRAWWATLARRSADTATSWRDMLRSWGWRAALVSLLSTAAVAALDEWHQAAIPGRTSSGSDVLLDSLAALFTQMLLIAVSAPSTAGRTDARDAEVISK